MRACQRNKNKSKESFREPLKQWHPSTRERLIRTSASNAVFDTKWGGFMSENWFNIDQTSCPFAFNAKQTYHLFEEGTNQYKEKVWISQPGSSLNKWECTLQIYFCPTRPHPKLAIIFRITRKHTSDDKVKTWNPDVDVYFQEKAWVDTKFSCD